MLLHLGTGGDAAATKLAFERHVVPLLQGADGDPETALAQAHLLGQLVGLDYRDSRPVQAVGEDGAQLRGRGFFAAFEWLTALAAAPGRPLLLVLDDLHWADEASLDFLEQLPRRLATQPVLVLAFARPSLLVRRPSWAQAAEGRHERIDLAPLGDEHNEALARDQRLYVTVAIGCTGGQHRSVFLVEQLVRHFSPVWTTLKRHRELDAS